MASSSKKKDAKISSGQKSLSSFFSTKVTKRPAEIDSINEPSKRARLSSDPSSRPDKPSPAPSSCPNELAEKQQPPRHTEAVILGQRTDCSRNEAKAHSEEPGEKDHISALPQELPETTVLGRGEPEQAAIKADSLTGKDLVGRSIEVFWSTEQQWYRGRVVGFNSLGKHSISYEDGDKEWVNLQQEQWRMAEKQTTRKKTAGIKSQVCLSSSDEESADDEESDYDAKKSDSDEGDLTDLESDLSGDENMPPPSKKASKTRPSAQKPSAKSGVKKVKPVTDQKLRRVTQQAAKQAITPGQKATLAGATGVQTPKTMTKDGDMSTNTMGASDLERFSARQAERFVFLHPDKIRDAAKRKPDHPEYNPRTLFIPPDWFKAAKVSEGQRQWWEFKAKNFDSVLLFKMGKFYEMFEMDAHTGAEVLGLVYMKGEQPHCGFPEANYHLHAERLARAGWRVVVIEQTETPDMLRIRNEERRAAGKPKAMVVSREVVGVLTKGTMVDPEMVRSQSDAAYVLALTESEGSGQGHQIGVCAVDCATAEITVGSWQDDEMRTTLRAHMAALRPVELVLPSDLSKQTRRILLSALRSPRVNTLVAGTDFWDAGETKRQIQNNAYFTGSRKCPEILEKLLDGEADNSLAASALGGMISFLKTVLLDKSIVGLGKVSLLNSVDNHQAKEQSDPECDEPEFVAMDGSALENLEILETTGGTVEGSLLAALDACATSAGRRRLKDWLCRPLGRVTAIERRQQAVRCLREEASDAAVSACQVFKDNRDIERSIAGLCASSIGSFGRNSAAVVLYEDAAKRKVNAFISVLKGLQAIQGALETFRRMGSALHSDELLSLVNPGRQCPNFEEPLGELMAAADWEAASLEGRVTPQQGVDQNFDAAETALQEMDQQLNTYLKGVRQELSCKQIVFVSLQKDSHVLEIPEEHAKKLAAKYQLLSQRKGFRRYMTDELRDLLRERSTCLENKENILAGILQGMVNKFAEEQATWSKLIWCVAELDALMSLAMAAEQASAWGPVTLPTFQRHIPDSPQVFEAKELRHPGMSQGDFVSNDISLGSPNFAVITGPNMGGKSTQIRQVCLAAVLAHAGCYVPAKSLHLTPVDAIFVRMGARDSIVTGQSTFFVELTETAAALNRATARSLVGLDELGRGTATSDGAAIASAVLQHFASVIQCRGLFATHYHKLSEEHENDPHAQICHMACSVAREADGHEQVTFLYKLVPGACPKSYGTNVARLAGIPDKIVTRASEFAAMLEANSVAAQARPAKLAESTVASQMQKVCAAMKDATNLLAVKELQTLLKQQLPSM